MFVLTAQYLKSLVVQDEERGGVARALLASTPGSGSGSPPVAQESHPRLLLLSAYLLTGTRLDSSPCPKIQVGI